MHAIYLGEEVIEVPRPIDIPPSTKWNKYCPVSADWRNVDPDDYLEKVCTILLYTLYYIT